MEKYYLYGTILFGLILIRFLFFISKYRLLKKALIKQMSFVESQNDTANKQLVKKGEKAANWIEENQIEIKNLVLRTGQKDQKISFMEPLGLGRIEKQSINSLDNLLWMNSDIMGKARQLINRAKGYYKYQAIKSFNPVFWIEFVLFLPREILTYLGVENNEKVGGLSIKLFQILYWIGALFFMYQNYLSNLNK